jgi:hypothetical protein
MRSNLSYIKSALLAGVALVAFAPVSPTQAQAIHLGGAGVSVGSVGVGTEGASAGGLAVGSGGITAGSTTIGGSGLARQGLGGSAGFFSGAAQFGNAAGQPTQRASNGNRRVVRVQPRQGQARVNVVGSRGATAAVNARNVSRQGVNNAAAVIRSSAHRPKLIRISRVGEFFWSENDDNSLVQQRRSAS